MNIRHLYQFFKTAPHRGCEVVAFELNIRQSFQLDVLDIDQDPKVPQNIPVEKGDSFYDYDLKQGWIIGEEAARTAKSTSRVRFFLWLAAGITSVAVVALWIRRRKLYA